jgi:hypothetical protein
VASSFMSSMRSSFASSSAIQIASQSPSASRNHSVASTPYMQPSLRSYRQSPSLSVSRSSVDLRNASQRSLASHMNSPRSIGYPSLSSLNSRYLSSHIPSPSNGSVSFLGSSSHQQHPLRYSESASSFSPFASANSLPDCWIVQLDLVIWLRCLCDWTHDCRVTELKRVAKWWLSAYFHVNASAFRTSVPCLLWQMISLLASGVHCNIFCDVSFLYMWWLRFLHFSGWWGWVQ